MIYLKLLDMDIACKWVSDDSYTFSILFLEEINIINSVRIEWLKGVY